MVSQKAAVNNRAEIHMFNFKPKGVAQMSKCHNFLKRIPELKPLFKFACTVAAHVILHHR